MNKAILTLLFLLPLLAACASGNAAPTVTPQTITLVAQDIAYDKNSLEGRVGQPINLEFSNQGALAHDFTIDEIEVSQEADSHEDHNESTTTESESDLHLHLETSEAETFTFTPLAAGSYTYYCSVPGHREAGMSGTLTVTEASP